MGHTWYYSNDIHGECFVVYVDSRNGSKKYWFRVGTGRFVDVVNGGRGRTFEQAFRLDFYSVRCLGALEDGPNLELAVRQKQLPHETLQALKEMWEGIAAQPQTLVRSRQVCCSRSLDRPLP